MANENFCNIGVAGARQSQKFTFLGNAENTLKHEKLENISVFLNLLLTPKFTAEQKMLTAAQ